MDENGVWSEDDEQVTTLKANFVISAFGSSLFDRKVISALEPLKPNKYGTIDVDLKTGKTNIPWIFSGGDIAGKQLKIRISSIKQQLILIVIIQESARLRWRP